MARSTTNLRRALSFARPFRTSVIIILTLAVGAAGLAALEPLVMKAIIDRLSDGSPLARVLQGVALLAALGVGRELAQGLSNIFTWRTRIGVHFDLLDATVTRLHSLPLDFHRNAGVGATLTRLERSIQGSVGAISELVFNTLPAMVYLVVAMISMARLDWRLFLVVMVFAPLPGLVAVFAAPTQARRERTLLTRWARIYGRFNEVLSGIMLVRSFAMEDVEKRRFMHDVSEANGVVLRGVRYDTGIGALQNLAVTTATLAAIAAGGWLVLEREATVGTLVAFLGYLAGMFGPVQGLLRIFSTVAMASVSLEQIFGILDTQEHLGDEPGAREVNKLRGHVQFDKVRFTYPGASQPLLRGLNLEAQPGEMVALVGPSGAGKSTLMALLQRFYDPDAGAVRIDGMDLRTLKQSSLRRQIGVVLQEPILFNDTLRNNIAYGKPNASHKEVVAAAKAANAHELIMALPDGYETMAGERGSLLSVGERQRVAIARALIKDPAVVVLDEATASLDADLEAQVQEALERLLHGRTTFVIAHRLITVVNAHRILVLKDGQISEMGSHAQLLEKGGYYQTLVRRQTRGLVEPHRLAV